MRTRPGLDAGEVSPPTFERVLVVEDEPRIRKRLSSLFRARGSRVWEATTVADALPLLEARPDLVVLDVRLPDGSGLAVAEACSLLDPPPPILATSGMASAREAFELARLGVHVFIPKPYSQSTLEERLLSIAGREAARVDETPSENRGAASPQLAQRLRAFAEAKGLSEAELEILRLAISGLPRRRFAQTLGVTENTCKTRIRRLLRKCEAATLADLPRQLLLRASD